MSGVCDAIGNAALILRLEWVSRYSTQWLWWRAAAVPTLEIACTLRTIIVSYSERGSECEVYVYEVSMSTWSCQQFRGDATVVDM